MFLQIDLVERIRPLLDCKNILPIYKLIFIRFKWEIRVLGILKLNKITWHLHEPDWHTRLLTQSAVVVHVWFRTLKQISLLISHANLELLQSVVRLHALQFTWVVKNISTKQLRMRKLDVENLLFQKNHNFCLIFWANKTLLN